jgi:pimeloyl-ACP methyl ester carboxylesterase
VDTILLLHGAIGAKDQLQELAETLQDKYTVHTINFTGHGGLPIPEEPFSIPLFANQVLEYMQLNEIDKAHIFGYSMGGYTGMYLAKNYPDRIKKLVTLATKYYWDEPVSAKEIPNLDAAIIENKFPDFAAQLKQRHLPQDWKIILEKTKELLLQLGRNNPLRLRHYTGITTPCLLLLGDRDKMVTREETIGVFSLLKNARLCILPATPHPIEQVDVELLSFFIKRFC